MKPLVMDAKYFYLALFLAASLAFVGSWFLSFLSIYFVFSFRSKEFTNRWIEHQAKVLGLRVCYVSVGEEDGRKKRIHNQR